MYGFLKKRVSKNVIFKNLIFKFKIHNNTKFKMCEFLVDGTYKCPKDAVYADSEFVYVTRNASNPITFLYNDPVFLIISMFVILIFISIIQLKESSCL